MILSKYCLICGDKILKTVKHGRKQWEKVKYCSRKCSSVNTKKLFTGRKVSEETKQKISAGNKGKIRTEECKVRISKTKKAQGLKPRLGILHSEETKKKISISKKQNPTKYWLGKQRSNETKKKISEGHKKSYENGRIPYWQDKVRPEITGENSTNWKGGKSKERARIWHSGKYQRWRKKVFERDRYTCQECGIIGIALEVHHIKKFSKYIELRFEMTNGITLCKKCHKKTRGKEEQFENYFINKLKNFSI